MLSEDKYQQGLAKLEEIKYTVEYDKTQIMNIIYSCLASWLLNHEYSADLTEEQISALECITNK